MPNKSELKVLYLSEIHLSNTNPRKSFDETALKELSLSIAEHGVLSPILVRPMNGGGYRLVCGERRYRSCIMAGIETIPCNIRNLSDDEAFELQIIENLERKDVHPLDEAHAFKQMLDSGRYKMEDIAAKMAKPEAFIVQRLKLNDLIPDIKKDFFDGELPIAHAVAISRLNDEQQISIFKEHKNAWNIQGYGSYNQLRLAINNKSVELKNVPFSLEVDFAHARACNVCATRSKSNPLLFSDMQGTDSCFNKTCYAAKLDAHLEAELESVMATTTDVLLAKSHSDMPSEAIIKMAGEYKTPILQSADHFFLDKREGTEKRKVLYTSGADRGKYGTVWVKKDALEAEPVAPDVAAQIKKIEDRAVRALELDAIKVHANIIEALTAAFSTKQPVNITFDADFITAMLLYQAIESNHGMPYYAQHLGIKVRNTYRKIEEIQEDMLSITPDQKVQLLAYLLFSKYKNSTDRTYLDGKLIVKLAQSIPAISVAEIEAAQQAKADKRIGNTAKVIAELKNPKKRTLAGKIGQALTDLIIPKN